MNASENQLPAEKLLEAPWAYIVQAVECLQFGSVTIQIHEGRIVQVDSLEKKRIVARTRHEKS